MVIDPVYLSSQCSDDCRRSGAGYQSESVSGSAGGVSSRGERQSVAHAATMLPT